MYLTVCSVGFSCWNPGFPGTLICPVSFCITITAIVISCCFFASVILRRCINVTGCVSWWGSRCFSLTCWARATKKISRIIVGIILVLEISVIPVILPPLVFVLQFCPTLGLALLCRIVCTIGERVIDILLHDIPSVFICNTDNFVALLEGLFTLIQNLLSCSYRLLLQKYSSFWYFVNMRTVEFVLPCVSLKFKFRRGHGRFWLFTLLQTNFYVDFFKQFFLMFR